MGTRRRFILGTLAASGALAVGWGVMPARQRLTTAQPLPVAPGQAAFNGWVKIGSDDTVTIVMPKSEMGQGAHTGLAMVLADELDADWSRVRLSPTPIDAIYANQATVVDALPFHPDDNGPLKRVVGHLTAKTMREMGVMVTGGSSSIKDLWLPMREAGASARAMLVAAAAQTWGVPSSEITVQRGVLRHASSQSSGQNGGQTERSARFGELALAAAQQPLPRAVVLKTPAQFQLIGQPTPRLEAAQKIDGSARYGIDVLQPGMLYASVRMCPTLGGKVAAFDGDAALRLPGVKQVLQVAGYHGGTAGVAAIADTPWHAMQAVKAVSVTWDEAVPAAAFDSAAAMDRLAQRLDNDDGLPYFSQGDVHAALQGAARTLSAEYRAPYLAHATLEPQNCTVQFKDGRATVWAPTQVPDVARRAAALALGIEADAVDVQVQLLGGGFGRRLDVDFIGQAAAIAKNAGGLPVQTFWTREEDTQHDFYRPATVARFKAGFDAQGRLTAWHNVSAGQAITPQMLSRVFGLPGAPMDKTASEGAFDQPYEWPHARIAHAIVAQPVPVGFWRSVGHSHHAFFKESFIDEAAHAVGQDPVAFRAALLQRHPRHLHVLQRVAALSSWGSAPAPAADGAPIARGVALHQSFGSIVAQVAEVSIAPGNAADKTIRVHRVFCVIDCGTPVNPNLIAQQMEGGIVFGLSAALYGRITIAKGQVQQSNFHDFGCLRIADCPVIQTEVVASTAHPEGVGEPGTPPIAPAVANALFALTGQRLRSLPLEVS